MTDSNSVCRYKEATDFIASMQDPKIRAALEYAITTVIIRRGMSPSVVSAAQFDLRYYLEAIKAMFEDEATIRAIIDGNDRDLRW